MPWLNSIREPCDSQSGDVSVRPRHLKVLFLNEWKMNKFFELFVLRF